MSALETLLAKCTTDASRVREALALAEAERAGWERDCRSALVRELRLNKAVAKARKCLRADRTDVYTAFDSIDAAYAALDWRQR